MWHVVHLAGDWEVEVAGDRGGPRRVRVPEEPPVPLGGPVPAKVVYRRSFHLGPEAGNAAARLELGGVLGTARVRLNGAVVEVPGAGLVPVAVPVTGLVRPGRNDLEIEVRHPRPAGGPVPGWGAYSRPEAVPPGVLPPGLTGPVGLVLYDGVLLTGLHWQVRWDEPPRPGTSPPRVAHWCLRVRYVAPRAAGGRCRVRLQPEGFAAPGVELAWDVEAAAAEGTWELWCSLPAPRLWTVWERGRPHLYRLTAWFEADAPSGPAVPAAGGTAGAGPAARPVWEGLVGVRVVDRVDGVWRLNGEPLFCRGACLLPLPGWPGGVTARQARAWARRARALQLNALRVYAHRAHPALYEAASRLGLVLWQDLPLTGPVTPGDVEALAAQLPAWVEAVGRWPAVIAWSASQEPAVPGAGTRSAGHRGAGPGQARPGGAGRLAAGRALLEAVRAGAGRRAVGELAGRLAALDPGRPVVARAGSLSWLRSGGDARFFPLGDGFPGRLAGRVARRPAGPRQGDPERWLRLVPHAATLVSSFGLCATTAPGAAPRQDGGQTAQAAFVRYTMEALRRRRAQPSGGGFVFALNDTGTGPGFGLFDGRGRPRPAARAYRDACRPVRLLLGGIPRRVRPGRAFRLPVWLVNDTARPVAGRWTWQLLAGQRVLAAATSSCRAGAMSLAPAGWVASRWPVGEPGPLALRLILALEEGTQAVEYPLPGEHGTARSSPAEPVAGGSGVAGAGGEPPRDEPVGTGARSPRDPAPRTRAVAGHEGNRVGVRFVL